MNQTPTPITDSPQLILDLLMSFMSVPMDEREAVEEVGIERVRAAMRDNLETPEGRKLLDKPEWNPAMPWCAFQGPWEDDLGDCRAEVNGETGRGKTEDEALVNWAVVSRVPLWNEEGGGL